MRERVAYCLRVGGRSEAIPLIERGLFPRTPRYRAAHSSQDNKQGLLGQRN
jgi:hypothetical protein